MERFIRIYSLLHSAYGPQGWWPLTPPGSTRTKHHSGRPMNDTHRFEIMLGAILTQNTAWTNVEKALEQLHKNKLVRHDRILKAKKERIAQLIRSAGYYNQKAERLVIISKFIRDNTIRSLMARDAADLRKMLLEVKGIGPETADSIVLYAFGKPSFVIDAYTKRVFSRIGICAADAEYDALKEIFEKNIKKDAVVYKEYHALIVEHAKRHCKAKPECEGCPISKLCEKII
ncbi:endonuclease III domain-containing protein [Candidatus Woesearchaeota archaeon]|nr:endonuclease III domain-containing protein [Candidatus Woesearchaeota archaeon]